jgi:hypothetical protein
VNTCGNVGDRRDGPKSLVGGLVRRSADAHRRASVARWSSRCRFAKRVHPMTRSS